MTFRTVALAVVLTLMAIPVQAQQRGPGPGRGMGPDVDQQMAELTEVLSLSDEQAVSVRAVLEEQSEKRAEMFAGAPPGDREAMRAAMVQLREETEAQLTEILTEEQMSAYREHVAERMNRRGPPF
ncbi:MAG: hypothetical protein R3195_02870 [Gemmatimonadota bacterium]|nr:hypothetical protein [Gemmatimonadota bacterium]